MKKKLSFVFNALMLFCMLPQVGFALPSKPATSILGTNIAGYVIFTSAGAITNAGKSTVNGSIGSGAGAISGFSSAIIPTSAANNALAIIDLNAAVLALSNNSTTPLPSLVLSGSMIPGNYSITGAASIPTSLIFNGAGTYIIKVSGAFATAASANVTLQNGATADNIFWLVQGAVAFGAGTTMQGNFISAAAIAVGAGSTINGRLLTTAGAIAVSGLTANNGIMVPPPAPVNITLPGVAHLALFNIYTAAGAIANAGKSKVYQSLNAATIPIYAGNVGSNAGAISGFTSPVTPESPDNNTIAAALEVGTLFTSLGNLIPNNDPLALELGGQTLTSTATSSIVTGTGNGISSGTIANVFVYTIPGAASITSTLTLKGSATDIFIFQVTGAMATAANATVVLNGVLASNIYWQVNGAVALGAGTKLAGNIVGGAAISIGAGSCINGNVYTTGGAIALGSSTIYNTTSIPTPPAYQIPKLLYLPNFNIFTASGAIANVGKSKVYDNVAPTAGYVGTNAGAISGFASTVTTVSAVVGTTDMAANEVASLFTSLSNANPTNKAPMALELGGLPAPLTAGIYAIPGAASITGTLTFDGGNVAGSDGTIALSPSIFVIQVTGAMATAANANVVLTGGALASNIYWQVNGAIALGAGTQLAGNIVGGAAIAIGAGSSINGNVYTIGGAIALGSSTIYNTIGIPATTPFVPLVGTNLSTFNIYTASGAIANAGKSKVYMNGNNLGYVGTNAGAISGFASTVTIATATNTTISAATDVAALFTSLANANPTNTAPMALEMAGLTLIGGVYDIPGAASITGTLTFNGGNVAGSNGIISLSPSIFIIQVTGAMATAANAKVVLIGGADPTKIYWQVNGAIALGAGTQLAGNIVGGAAIAIGAGSSINGNVYTIGGAIALGSSTVYNTTIPATAAYVPIVPSDLMKFQIYTGAGAITDAASSNFKTSGLVGTGAGAITGIPAANISSSSTAAGEIATLFTALSNATPTPTTTTPMALELGGQTLTAGVYAIPGAASLTGALTLDAQNNPNAIFIFQVTGAMATAASATVVLGNGALAKNIFWQIDGAVALGAGTNFDGTIVSGAAIAIGANCTVQGDVYTTGGAITISGTSFTNNNITRSTTSLMNINGLVNTSENLSMYPNPNHGKINLVYNGDKTQVVATQVYDANMHLVYTTPGFKASIEIPSAQAGVNFIYLKLKTKTLTHKFVLLKN